MLCVFEKDVPEVRFGTEKNIGFPALTAIFHKAVARVRRSDGGAHPRNFVGLAIC